MRYRIDRFEKDLLVSDMLATYFDYETTLDCCRNCPSFASTWSCPEFDFDVREYWEQFRTFRFIADRVSNEGTTSPEEAQSRLFREKDRFDSEMLAMESEGPGCRALYAQECDLCKKCARLSGLPCVHPEKMRYALESLGMLAVNMTRDVFGIDVQWSDGTQIPEYYLLLGGLLIP